MIHWGDIMSISGCSVHRRDIISTSGGYHSMWGDIVSKSGGFQYIRFFDIN